MRRTPRMKKETLLIALMSALLFLALNYLFIPLAPLTFPPQEQFRADPDIRLVLDRVAEEWGVPESNLSVFAVEYLSYGDKGVAIIDPKSLSSAKVWIASPQSQPGQPTSGLPLPGRLHVLSQYTPQSALERAIAHNFYTKSRVAQSDKAVVAHIRFRLPFGEIRATSLTTGGLYIPVLLTYPLPIALHIDY